MDSESELSYEPSLRLTCEKADTQGAKYARSSHYAKGVGKVLEHP